MNKFKNKLLTYFSITILLFWQLAPFIQYTYAEDSPEEIARQEQEAQSQKERDEQKAQQDAQRSTEEAERDAQRQAEREAQQAQEVAREAVEDLSPTPTSIPQPTITVDPSTDTAQVQGSTPATDESLETQSANPENTEAQDQANVDNNNSGSVNNNVDTESNTGNNVISGENPTPTQPATDNQEENNNPLPVCEDNVKKSASNAGEESNLLYNSDEVAASSDTSQSLSSENSNPSDVSTQDNDTLTTVNSNCASLSNDQDITATSGNNTVSDNDGSSGLVTGAASTDSRLTNKSNENVAETQHEAAENTLEKSEGSSDSQDKDSLSVENNNQIYVENDVNVESKTGSNTVANNDGKADLTTGDVDMLVTLLNILNLNITGEDFTHLIINIFGDLSGDIDLDKIAANLGMSEDDLVAIARNDQTESEREKNEEIRQERERNAEIANNNEAVVQNNVDVYGETGNNDVSGNEDRSKLLTGRIKILVALINFINTNYTGTDWYFAMVNIFGSLQGDLILPDPNGFLIDSSGASSQSQSNSDGTDITKTNTENSNITNNNQVAIDNNIQVTGDSGSNVAYGNEDRVKQNTGEVDVVTSLSNWLNINIVGNNWVLLVINVFGKWYGQIIGFPGQDAINAPDSGMLMVAAGGTGDSGPLITEGSTPQADTEFTNKENTTVENNNVAEIENNINIAGVSGTNTTNSNEDPVTVTTGWVDISANLLNIVNMNITGKKWMLVLVNIFGDFIGDVTFPGAKPKIVDEFKSDNTFITELNSSAQVNTGSDNKTSTEEEATEVENNMIPATAQAEVSIMTLEKKVNEPKIEIYTAANIANSDNTPQILGIAIKADRQTQTTLFLIALFTYLIAMRFWAVKK